MLQSADFAAGSYNTLTQAGDAGIIFNQGAVETGAFVIGPWSASAKGIRIDGVTGKVGIGTAAPSQALDVNGSVKAGTSGGVSFIPATNSAIRDETNGASTLYFDVSTGGATHGAFNFRSSNTYKSLTYMDGATGYVGIGTIAPSYALDVSGSARVTSLVYSSDARLKDHIVPLDSGLALVAKLRPVRFNWKAAPALGTQLGLIAQEVQQVVPEVVTVAHDASRTMGVNYPGLVPVLIDAVQELKADNDALRAVVERQAAVVDQQARVVMRQTQVVTDLQRAVTDLQGQLKAANDNVERRLRAVEGRR
jgi:hypothetical protein